MADGSFLLRAIAFLALPIIASATLDGSTSKLTTKFGRVRGVWSRSSRGRLVAHYLGIPYAEPPVGDLRFRSPKPWSGTWNETFEAIKNGPACLQVASNGSVVGSEDCLYLNVYVPVVSEKREENRRLPVMVYVHGGRFATGYSDSRMLPPDYLMDQDVILVAINYRLNVLGFLGTGSKASPGNYGLKDIMAALRWVQENIESFGGDRNSVTLWGHSAGAGAVHALALSPKTEGLFNRYILQSGNALCSWDLNARQWMERITLETADMLDCLPVQPSDPGHTWMRKNASAMQPEETMPAEKKYDEEQEEEIMECLRNVDARKIGEVAKYHMSRNQYACCIFSIVIEEESDDALVTMHPLTVIRKRLFRDIPFVIGVVRDEGLAKTIGILRNETAKDDLIENFETYTPYLLDYYQKISNASEFVDAIEDFYFDGNVSATLTRNITQVASDALMIWPSYRTLRYQSERMESSTYFYLFSYEGTFSSTFSSGSTARYGVSHTDDLNYLLPLLNKMYEDQMLHNTESDVTMINIMTEMWASFAATGVPKAWRIPEWPNYKESKQFLQFGVGNVPEVIVQDEFLPERMTFWDELATYIDLDNAEAETLIEPLIADEPPGENSGSRNKYSERLFGLLAFLVLCLL